MVQIRTSRVEINRSVIYGYTLKATGLVRKDARAMTRETVYLAKEKAPKRTGRLAASIADKHDWANQYGCQRSIEASASYARFVLGGTKGNGTGYIYAKHRARGQGGRFSGLGWLAVGRSQGGPVIWKQRVKGQRANNFLGEALSTTMLRYQT